jgi:RNA polymerase sigma-70 factor (TIGR02957 family)
VTEQELLASLRGVSFAVAYRMLGTVSEAEDIVQEALLRVHRALESGEHIASPRAYVTTITTRLAIDELRSARSRRERYVGDWLPEPIVTDGDPADAAELADSLSMAMLVLLERLSPEQRAAILLRDVFDYDYDAISAIVGKTPDAARQLVSRARKHIDDGRPRFSSTRERQDELIERFLAAARGGDLGGLEAVLAHDVTLTGDGGGKAPALARRLVGRSRVAHMLTNWLKAGARIPGATIARSRVNGGPGALLLDGAGRLIGVWSFEVRDGHIASINSVVNPDKLRHLGPIADFGDALRRQR